MMTVPRTKARKRRETSQPPAAKRRRRQRLFAWGGSAWDGSAWDGAFADPAAIESDYPRMARRQQDRSGE